MLVGYNDRSEADQNTIARTLLTKLDATESQLKTNEIAFKKQVKDHDLQIRKVLDGKLSLEKRKRTLADINAQNAANSSFHEQLMRRATSSGRLY